MNVRPTPAATRHIAHHPASVPTTVREVTPATAPSRANGVVTLYPRAGLEPYTVIHDRRAQSLTGLFRVFVGCRYVGAQASYPSADDCARMDLPNRYAAPAGWNALPPDERARRSHSIAVGNSLKQSQANGTAKSRRTRSGEDLATVGARLSFDQCQSLRARHRAMPTLSYYALGAEYGVSNVTAANICTNKTRVHS
jgi:hypothetical protein